MGHQIPGVYLTDGIVAVLIKASTADTQPGQSIWKISILQKAEGHTSHGFVHSTGALQEIGTHALTYSSIQTYHFALVEKDWTTTKSGKLLVCRLGYRDGQGDIRGCYVLTV